MHNKGFKNYTLIAQRSINKRNNLSIAILVCIDKTVSAFFVCVDLFIQKLI